MTDRAAWPATMIRWGARLLSVAILLFWGFFLVAHLFGDEGAPSRPLVAKDYLILATVVVSLAGLALAWKWELLGGGLALAAILLCAALNWRVLVFPGTLIPITAAVFLLSWWLGRVSRGEFVARPATR